MNKLYGTDQNLYVCGNSYPIMRNRQRTKDFEDIFYYSDLNKMYFRRPAKTSEIEQKFQQNLYTGKIGNKIYFHPNSEFPRFKLMGTDFKRTIKPDKADVIVIPEYTNISIWGSDYYIYEGDNGLYAIPEYLFSGYFNSSSDEFIKDVKN